VRLLDDVRRNVPVNHATEYAIGHVSRAILSLLRGLFKAICDTCRDCREVAMSESK
jgi:hypothetical protein